MDSYFADKCLCLKKCIIYLLQLEGSTETDRKAFGVFLIVLDVCFLVGTVASIAAVVYMLAQHTAEERKKGSAATTKILPSDEKVAKLRSDEIRKWERSAGGESGEGGEGSDGGDGVDDGGGDGGDGDGDEEQWKREQINTIHVSTAEQRRASRRSSHRHINSEHANL